MPDGVQAIVMYMSGGGVQIFSMMSIGMLMKSSVGSMLAVNKGARPPASCRRDGELTSAVFAPYVSAPLPNATSATSSEGAVGEVDAMLLQKALYIACQAALLGVALYKCHSMGLLPTATSDWLAFREAPMVRGDNSSL
jgi:hypothetical protein